jgi:hypothetical protein
MNKRKKIVSCSSAGLLTAFLAVLTAAPSAWAQVECDKPNIMIVQDSSSSMDTKDSGQTKTRWQIARDATISLLTSYGSQARWGIMVYPIDDDCQAPTWTSTGYYVAVGDSTASAITSIVNRNSSYGGNTPGYQTMVNASKPQVGLHDPSRLSFVVYITDGEPNCLSDCPYGSEPECTINATAALFASGIKTFVIGMGSSAYESTLNAMAQAGGTARSGTKKYYAATSPTEMNAALDEIVHLATTRPCKNACGSGFETCVNKKWANCTAPTDCCTSTFDYCDTGLPGICADGQMICVNAVLTCVQYNQKTTEVCNALDDDCNAKIDDNIPARECMNTCGNKGHEFCEMGQWVGCDAEPCCEEGASCDTGLPGICGEGVIKCVDEVQQCIQVNDPMDHEICNNKDDNCNGEIDEGNPGGGDVCVTGMKGECGYGHTVCIGGNIVCVQDLTPVPEICNGLDDDCDGVIDNGVTNQCGTCGDIPPDACFKGDVCKGYIICKKDQTCVNGECANQCINNECPGGLKCMDGNCVSLCNGVTCEPSQTCYQGQCYDPCKGVSCGEGKVCKNGQCVADNCYEAGCEKGKICRNNGCIDDPCEDVTCDPNAGGKGQFCRDGSCVYSCGRVSCAENQKCKDGNCIADPCYKIKCDPGKICDDSGGCVTDPCSGVQCGKNRICSGGVCVDDPCIGVTCPRVVESCAGGQCLIPTDLPDGGMDGGDADASDGSIDASPDIGDASTDTGDTGKPVDDGATDGPMSDGSIPGDGGNVPDGGQGGGSGCSCSTADLNDGGMGLTFMLLGLLALIGVVARARKR